MLRDVSQDSADEFQPRLCDRYSSDESEDNHPATSNPEDLAIFTEPAGAGNLVFGVLSLRRLRMARRPPSVACAHLTAPTVPRHGPSGSHRPHRFQHFVAITDSINAATCSPECQDAMISDDVNDGVSAEPDEKSSDGDRRPRRDGRPQKTERASFTCIPPPRNSSQERNHRRQRSSDMQPSQEPVCEPELDICGSVQPSQEPAASNMSGAAARDPEVAGYGNMQPPPQRGTSNMACAAGYGEPLQERTASYVAWRRRRATPGLVGFGSM